MLLIRPSFKAKKGKSKVSKKQNKNKQTQALRTPYASARNNT